MHEQVRQAKGPVPTTDLRRVLLVNVHRFAPVYRYSDSWTHGESAIDEVMKKGKDVGITDRSVVWNTDLIETLELENFFNQAAQEMCSAEAREESRGTMLARTPLSGTTSTGRNTH